MREVEIDGRQEQDHFHFVGGKMVHEDPDMCTTPFVMVVDWL